MKDLFKKLFGLSAPKIEVPTAAQSFSKDFESAAKTKDFKRQAEIFETVASTLGYQSREMAEIMYLAVLYDLNQKKAYELFLSANPSAVHVAQIGYAACLTNENRNDEATQTARDYVRRMNDLVETKKIALSDFETHCLGRGYLMITAVYTEVGARSYSIRILERALRSNISDIMTGYIGNELTTLRNELKEEAHASIDAKWEEFFHSGAHFKELHELCRSKNAPLLARRLELLEGQFRFNVSHTFNELEMFNLLLVTEENTAMLV